MDEPSSKSSQSWFERLVGRLTHDEPETQAELIETLRTAFNRQLLDADTLAMIESVLEFSDLEVRDIMVSRSQMDVIRETESIDRLVTYIVETTHSRFPVIGEDKDHVQGILHAKDLLKYFANPETFSLTANLRPATFVPESKPLNALLSEFRSTHNHMAIVVDEYGGVSGLVTIEDVIEEIIGEIEDEFDHDNRADNIVTIAPDRFRVKAFTEITDINDFFGTQFSNDEVDSIGGLVIQELGYLPVRGEKVTIGKLQITVARVDARRLHTLMITTVANS